jgi:hypothetical protein
LRAVGFISAAVALESHLKREHLGLTLEPWA